MLAIDVQHVSVSVGDKEILHDICMQVPLGARVGIIGESGSGKSLLIRAIMGLLPEHARITHGDIVLFGQSVVNASQEDMADLRGRIVSMVFQFPDQVLNPVKTVQEQIMTSLQLHYDLPKNEMIERVYEQLRRVGLDTQLATSYPHELSGGQQQRVAIAAALIGSPRLLIADEPTSALDSVVARDVCQTLVRQVQDANLSLLFVTHDFMMLQRAATYCYVVHQGRVVEDGDCRELLDYAQHEVTRQLISNAQFLMLEAQ